MDPSIRKKTQHVAQTRLAAVVWWDPQQRGRPAEEKSSPMYCANWTCGRGTLHTELIHDQSRDDDQHEANGNGTMANDSSGSTRPEMELSA